MEPVATLRGKYAITYHARQRYVERFSECANEFQHLGNCKGCNNCTSLMYKMRNMLSDRRKWNDIICAKLEKADDIRIFQNNDRFMTYMYERYGYHRYSFLVYEDALFVVIERDGEKVVVTCVDAREKFNGSYVIADFLNRPKYQKRVS